MTLRPIRLTYTVFLQPRYDYFGAADSDLFYEAVEAALEAVYDKLRGITLQFANRGIGWPDSLAIGVDSLNTDDHAYLSAAQKSPRTTAGTPLRFTARWNRPDRIADRLIEQGRHHTRDVVTRVCNGELASFIDKFCVALSLYVPNAGEHSRGYSSFKDRLEGTHFATCGPLDSAAGYMFDNGIPLTPDISLEQFLHWIFECSGYWTNSAETNVERSLNYISHAFDREHHSYQFEEFVWLMGALEAIYCSTTAAISEKFRERVAVLLPELATTFTKKSINSLYEFRSKFLHGSMKLPNKFVGDNLVDMPKYIFDFSDRLAEASTLSIKSIHAIAKLNKTSIAFKESVL